MELVLFEDVYICLVGFFVVFYDYLAVNKLKTNKTKNIFSLFFFSSYDV